MANNSDKISIEFIFGFGVYYQFFCGMLEFALAKT